jgi:putative phosphoribosyl transferase
VTDDTQVVEMRRDVTHPRRVYRDRRDAGQRLAAALDDYTNRPDVQVFAIPRGGVPVAYEVAKQLMAPLDVVVVRKLGLPFQPELAMGAIASGGVRVLNPDVVELGVPTRVIDAVASRELKELARRERAYRGQSPALDPKGHTVIVVDDGLATGSTMRAAIASVRDRGAASVVVAVPVGASSTCNEIAREADRLVCPLRPPDFLGVGAWFADFSQTTDEEVRELLESAND